MEAARKREAEEAAAREADRKHRREVLDRIAGSLQAHGISVSTAQAIANAMARGEVPNVKVVF